VDNTRLDLKILNEVLPLVDAVVEAPLLPVGPRHLLAVPGNSNLPLPEVFRT
jgi:hypothetical protein